MLATTSGPDDLAIIISYEGRLINIDLISSYDYKMKNRIPDYHIYMSFYEHKYVKVANFSTRLSLLYILDGLYSCYFEKDYKNNLEKKIEYARLSAVNKYEE